jgi:small subunit ribosomal protein S2
MERSGMAVVTMRQLLEAGVHFGHQTRRWNPKMKRFIFGERNGIYIIDLNQTLQRLDVSYSFIRDLVANNGNVLFIGTKKQSQDPIARSALSCGMPFVNERWLGGMLTNFSTIALRVKKMQEYERMRSAGDFEAMPKKEALILTRELEKLERNLGGIRDMATLPDVVFIIDIKKEHIAVSEANKMGIPIVAVVDTNCDPDLVQYPIPGNDDAIRSGTLMCHVIAEAVQEGRFIASRRGTMVAPAASTAGPIARAFEPAREEPVRPAAPAPVATAERSAPAGPGPTQQEPAGAPQSVSAAAAAPAPSSPSDGPTDGMAPEPALQGGVPGGERATEAGGTSDEEAGSPRAHEATTTSEAPGGPAGEADLPSNVAAEVAAAPDH